MSVIFAGRYLMRAPEIHDFGRALASDFADTFRIFGVDDPPCSIRDRLSPQLVKLESSDPYKNISHELIRWYTGLWAALTMLFLPTALSVKFGLLQLLIFFFTIVAVLRLALTIGRFVLSRSAAPLVINVCDSFDVRSGRVDETCQPVPSP